MVIARVISAADLKFFFFFNDTATTEIYTLSLHDALPIYPHALRSGTVVRARQRGGRGGGREQAGRLPDRKSTRLNSSHGYISYAVFCLKKKKECWPSCACVGRVQLESSH